MPIFRWRKLIEKKGISDFYLIDAWADIIFNVVFTKETTVVNNPVSGIKVKRAVLASTGSICRLLKLDYYDREEYIEAEKKTIEIVNAVYSVLNENNIETGYKVDGEIVDKAILLIDFEKMPKLI